LPFIERGIPTFIEKPMTTSLKEAQQLERAAKKSGARIMVGHIHLYNSAYQKAKALAEKSGKVRSLFFEGMNNGPVRDDMSALWDWSPHDISMAIDVIGKLPVSVQAWGQKILRPRTDLYDTVMLRLEFSGGVVATIHNSWLFPEKRKKMVVVGAKGMVVYDDVKPDQKVAHYKGMGPKVTSLLRGARGVQWQESKVSYPRYGTMSPLETEMRAFLKIIQTGKNTLTDLRNGLDVVRVLAAAERSLELDGKVVNC
jgi:predicted dehydrogenase